MPIVARDLMQRDVLTVPPTLTLVELDARLAEAGVSGFPVVENGQLLGVVSRTDLVRAVSQAFDRAESLAYYFEEQGTQFVPVQRLLERESEMVAEQMAQGSVKDIMTSSLVAVEPDAPVDDIARRMVEHRVHRVLVTEDGRLLGIVSSLDLARLIAEGRLAPAS